MKKILALVMTLAMLLSCVTIPAFAVEEEAATGEKCPHCNLPWDDCGWEAFDTLDLSEPVPGGHYYLTEDTQTTSLMGIGVSDGQPAEDAVDVCLDLRGFSLERTTSGARAVYVYDHSRFDLLDSVGGGKFSGGGNTTGGTVYVANAGQFHLHSGTLSNTSTAFTKNGGVIYGSQGSFIYIHDGIVDATGVAHKDTDTSATGGAIYAYGECRIEGGLILGGSMYRAGTVYVASAGTLYMTGGMLYGGQASNNGGNICNYGDTYISGGKIIGGVSGNNGGNIYSGYAASSSNLYSDLHISGGYIADGQASSNGSNVVFYSGYGSVTGGEIKGNVYTKIALELSGSPVIDNYGYEGLYLSGAKLVIKDLSDDARIIMRASSQMTDAETSPDAPKYLENGQLIPCSRYDLKVENGAIVCSQDDEGYCPHCRQNVTWAVYTADSNTSGHYYTKSGGFSVAETDTARVIAEGVDIVVNMAHSSVKTAARYEVAGKLTLLTTATNSITFTNTATSNSVSGADLYVTGELNFYDGVIKGVTTTANAGAVYLAGGVMNMYGGFVRDGSAKNGGNIYAYGSGSKLNIYGGVITDGNATDTAGNVYAGTATVNMYDGVIGKATAVGNGGNVQLGASGVMYFRDGMLLGGDTDSFGGNLYMASTNTKFYMYNGVMLGGSAKSGGNIYGNNGILNITGGSILSGTATESGGNIYNNAGKYFITNGGDLSKNYLYLGDTADAISAPLVCGGSAKYGGDLFVAGITTVGAVTVKGGKATSGQAMYLAEYGRLTVEPGFTGTHQLAAHTTRLAELTEQSAFAYTSCTELNATIYVENYDGALLVRTDAGLLGLAGASLIALSNGAQQWFRTAQEAIDACQEGYYVKLYGTGHNLTMKADMVLDVNGAVASVTGSGKLSAFDSSNDSYSKCGALTLSGVTADATFVAPNGSTYVALTEGERVSFHRVGVAITEVVLRPTEAGIYYKGQFLCDDTLGALVDSFGIAVSLVDSPDENFAQDQDTLYSAYSGDNLKRADNTSVLIKDIFKDSATAAQCKSRGEEFIFANAYMKLNIGTDTVTVMSADTDPWSMKTVLQQLHTHWPSASETQQTALMENLYKPYISSFDEDWGLFYMRYEFRDMTDEEAAILAERRQIVLDYMRSSTSVLWKATETLTYGLAARDNGTTLKVVAGRTYQGLPYSYSVGTEASFLEYATGQDENGVYTIAGLEATALNYESYGGRVGNDCSGAVTNAWSQVGTSFTASRSANMTNKWGALPVGDYDFCPTINPTSKVITYTGVVTKTNGEQRIYEAYADLLPADAVFYVATSGANHIRMVSEVHVVRNDDGTIDGENSYLTVLEQTRTNTNAVRTKTVEGVGKVYIIGGVDVKYTFAKLFSTNYIPCTIKELRDPSPVEETWITDTQMEHTAENIFEGNVLSNRFIDCVNVTITDMDGNTVQSVTGRARRGYNKNYQMTRFLTEKPGSMIGSVDVSLLEAGQYRCTVTARLTTGESYVVRDFTFTR